MSLKQVTIVVAVLVLILQWPLYNCARADGKLTEFYSDIASARLESARTNIDEAIRLWPSNARYYGWRAYGTSQKLPPSCPRKTGVALGADDEQAAREAILDYRHSLQINPRDAVAFHNLAWLEHILKDDAEAQKDWHQATALDPDNAVFHLSYGMFLEEAGNGEAAAREYEAAISRSPSMLDSPFFAQYHERSPEKIKLLVTHCVTQMEGELKRGRDSILEARLGKLYQYLGDLPHSEQLLQGVAKELPNLPLVWFNLGQLYEVRGDTEKALDCYKKASVVDGSLSGPYLHMGEIYLRSGQKATAAQNLRIALQRWAHMKPITAAHNNRLYQGPPQKIDDLLPTTLVWNVTPCAASRASAGLAALHPGKPEYARGVRTCETLPSPHEIRENSVKDSGV